MNTKELTDRYDKMSEKIVQFMERITVATEQINDTNRLHKECLQKNTDALVAMKDQRQSDLDVTAQYISIIKWVVIITVSALAIVSGAKEVLKFLP